MHLHAISLPHIFRSALSWVTAKVPHPLASGNPSMVLWAEHTVEVLSPASDFLYLLLFFFLLSGAGTTMYCSQHSTERLHCICNNVATEHAQSNTVTTTVGIYYICIIENGYSVFARSAFYTQNARHSAIGPSYWQQLLLAIANQPN